MPQFLVRAISRLGSARWVAVPAGAVLAYFSGLGIWFLFELKDFSSAVRDELENAPGFLDYMFFAVALAILASLLWLGICSIVLGMKRSRGA